MPVKRKHIEVVEDKDEDAPALTATELAKLRPVSPVKKLRWKLGLTQVAFAKLYRIPIGTLRDWEQGRTKPDAPALAYLHVIKAQPETIAKLHRAA